MDKLGEGTYGVVYMARGISILIQISRLTKYSHSKKYGLKVKRREFLQRPFVKFPFSSNSVMSTLFIWGKSFIPIVNWFLSLSIWSMTSKSTWEILANKLVWTQWLLRYLFSHYFRAFVTSYCKGSIIVMKKKCFIVILSPKIYWFRKITFLKLQILGLREPQEFQLKDTRMKLSHCGTGRLMCF